MQQVSDYEPELMRITWENGSRVLYAGIVEGLGARGGSWTKNMTITLLSRLMEKGLLKSSKIGQENECMAMMMEESHQATQTEAFLHKLYQGDVKGLVYTLIEKEMFSPKNYEELKQFWGSRGVDHD